MLIIILLVLRSAHSKTINVCATPEPGYWDASKTLNVGMPNSKVIYDEIKENKKDDPPTFTGIQPGGTWRLSGFYADLLPQIMFRAGITDYKVSFYSTYSRALYETTKTKRCDVGFTPFTATPSRSHCLSIPHGNTPACTNPQPGRDPEPKHACCASFGTPPQAVTLALMVTAIPPSPSPLMAILNYQTINIVALMTLAIIFSAHLVWYMEKDKNPQQFPPLYLDGIDDAIWWSCATVTTVGYGDKYPITNLGRLFALVWMFTGVAFLGLFAGTIAGAVENSARDLSINSIHDLSVNDNICTPSTLYASRYLEKFFLHKFQYYVSEEETVQGCIDDLLQGTATGIFNEGPILKHLFLTTPKLLDSGYKVVEGEKQEFLGPVFPYNNNNNDETPSLQSKMDLSMLEYTSTEEFAEKVNKYFPETKEQKMRSEDSINWLYVAPCGIYIIIYWLFCFVDKYRQGEFNRMWCCQFFPIFRRKKEDDTFKKTNQKDENNQRSGLSNYHASISARKNTIVDRNGKNEKGVLTLPHHNSTSKEEKIAQHNSGGIEDEHLDMEASAYSTSIALSLSKGTRRQSAKRLMSRNSIFVKRGLELRKDIESNEKHNHGHNRMLFADGPEFVGLSQEVHTLHRLLLSQSASLMTMADRLNISDHDNTDDENVEKKDKEEKDKEEKDKEEKDKEDVEEEEEEFSIPSTPSGPTSTTRIKINLSDLIE